MKEDDKPDTVKPEPMWTIEQVASAEPCTKAEPTSTDEHTTNAKPGSKAESTEKGVSM